MFIVTAAIPQLLGMFLSPAFSVAASPPLTTDIALGIAHSPTFSMLPPIYLTRTVILPCCALSPAPTYPWGEDM